MTIPDERIERLPKWAQEYIASLHREIDLARSRERDLREVFEPQTYEGLPDEEQPPVIMRSSLMKPAMVLDPDGRVVYHFGGRRNEIEVTHNEDHIRVSGYSGIAVIPAASNSILVYLRD